MAAPDWKYSRNLSQNSLAKQYAAYSDLESQRWQELHNQNVQSWVDVWEQRVDRQPDACIVEDIGTAQPWTYRSLDQAADKIAAWAVSTQEQYIGVHQPNGAIFLATVLGLAKAGITAFLFSHRHLIGAGIAWSLRTGITSNSCCYIPLPLYHGNGLAIGFASCVEAGACAVVRDRFSVRAFLPDIRQYQCDAAVYIGEFWRYLMNHAPRSDDADNPLKIIFGNGLMSPLWEEVLERFGIEHVVEHYGATEMPASALTN